MTAADHTAQRHTVSELEVAVCGSSYGMHAGWQRNKLCYLDNMGEAEWKQTV